MQHVLLGGLPLGLLKHPPLKSPNSQFKLPTLVTRFHDGSPSSILLNINVYIGIDNPQAWLMFAKPTGSTPGLERFCFGPSRQDIKSLAYQSVQGQPRLFGGRLMFLVPLEKTQLP